MNNYKFEKINNTRSFIKQYANDADAQSFADSYDGGGWTWTNLGSTPQKSASELLASDKQFLLELMNNFVIENRNANVNAAESIELLNAFNSIKQLSEVGAVPEVRASIADLVPPIGRVYTLERQSDDLSKIDKYISIR